MGLRMAESPAPGQRGTGDGRPQAPPPRRRVPWRWLAFFAALLVINYWAGSRAMHAQSRVRVPYSPFFLQQVKAGARRRDHLERNGDPGNVRASEEL